jgi:GTP cyclohydrolase II
MFTYLDPTVRQRLVRQGKLVRIDGQGRPLDPDGTLGVGDIALSVLGPIPLPVRVTGSELQTAWYAFVRHTELAKVDELAAELRQRGGQQWFSLLASSMAVNSVLVVGNGLTSTSPLVRVHSSCLTGDVFGSERCECGPQLSAAIDRMAEDPQGGLLVYMAGHEGRGIGLWAKAATYLLQDAGEDTYQANRTLGLPDDSRDFSDAASILKYFLGERPFRLLTNNPKKIEDLARHGLTRVERERHIVGVSRWNSRYLRAKRARGHRLNEDDIPL